MILTAQSNLLTLSRQDLSMYQKKVLFAIVDTLSPHLKNVILAKKKGIETNYQESVSETSQITYKAKDLCPANRYTELRQALKMFKDKTIEIETDEFWLGTGIVLKYRFEKRSEEVKITVDRELFQFLFDISKGYTLFQIKAVLSFQSTYAMRMYELIAKWRNKEKFFISVEELRTQTATENKFKQVGELKKRVLDVAKKNLDISTVSDLRFNYTTKKRGRRVEGFEISIIKTEHSHESEKIKNTMSPRWILSKEIVDFLGLFGIILKGKTLEIVTQFAGKYKNTSSFILKVEEYERKAKQKRLEKKEIAGFLIGCMKQEIGQNRGCRGVKKR